MDILTHKSLWSLIILLLRDAVGDGGYNVSYPTPKICAFPGSTVTLPCTFTYPAGSTVKRLIWCQNHLICQGTTPSVYDSYVLQDSRYKYIGDFINNCALQIQKIEDQDNKVHRFRFETIDNQYTGTSGVSVMVGRMKMRISTSINTRGLKVGDNITLTCTALCSFLQMDISWYRDDLLLEETSPSLHLSPLTVTDSGNYSCALRTHERNTRSNQGATSTRSHPYRLSVEEPQPPPPDQSNYVFIAMGFGVLLTTLAVVFATILIKRRRQAVIQSKESKHINSAPPADPIYDNIEDCVEAPADKEELNYVTVQFKHQTSPSCGAKLQQRPEAAPVIYSTVNRCQ